MSKFILLILVILIIVGIVYAGTKKELAPKSSDALRNSPTITLEGIVTWGIVLIMLGLAIWGYVNEGPAVYAPPIGVIKGMYPPLNHAHGRKRK